MRTISNEYYEVKGVDGFYGLAEKFETLDDAIEGGKEMNKTEIENGYKPSDWIVTRTTWSRLFDDDGKFMSETSNTIRMFTE